MSPEYIEVNRWLGLHFEWGVRDCVLILGDWIMSRGRPNPFEADLFTYDSAGSCQRATSFFTEPVQVLEYRFARIGGLPRAEVPQAGDVGVLIGDAAGRPSGALCLGPEWAMFSPNGPITVKTRLVEPLAVWRVPE